MAVSYTHLTGPRIDVAIVECTAVTEDGLYFGASAGSADAAVRNADKVIVEVNETLPMGSVSYTHLDVYKRQVPVNRPRIGNVALRRDHITGPVR